MEALDDFVRTLSDNDGGDEFSDSDSSPEFDARDEKTGAGGDPFFQVRSESAWSFEKARESAQAAQSFQTHIDEKIRRARALAVDKPVPEPTALSDEEIESSEGEESASRENGNSRDSESQTHANDEASDQPETTSAPNESENDLKGMDQIAKKKGKKRMRKEAQADSATFESMHLSRALLKAISTLDWTKPTPVQARAIPYILAGRDVCGSAVTGSGKTGAFALPVIERLVRSGVDNATRAIVLLPTRELAAQCHAVFVSLAKHSAVRTALAVGGLSNKLQEAALRSRPHIVIATPGRLIDHIRNAHGFSLEDIEILVMDEADRLLEMGFKDEVEEIIRFTPASTRQTLLFSATMNRNLNALIKLSLKNPINISVDPLFDVASTLSQEFVKVKESQVSNKDAILLSLATRSFRQRTIVFFRQKVTAHRFKILFGLARLRCAELHGNLTQAQRLEALDLFREGAVDFLLCTDLAARGLDILGVETVVNYDMPGEVTEYVHRVGRTARAGAEGRACSIVCTDSNDERRVLRQVASRAKSQLSARVVKPAAIGKWRAWIDSMNDAVKSVLKEERHEKELRLAEMELEKAGNLLRHADEIHSRPARTWFQTSKERKTAADAERKAKGLPTRSDTQEGDARKAKEALVEERRKKSRSAERERGYAMQRQQKAISKKRKRVR